MEKHEEWVTAELRAAYEAGKQAARFDQAGAARLVNRWPLALRPQPKEKDEWHH